MTTPAPRLFAALAVAVSLTAAACGGSGPGGGPGGSPSTGAQGKKEVVLVTYDAYALPEAAAAAFKEQTGASIKVVASGDSGATLSKALLSAGSPEGDVLFGVDNLSATTAMKADLLVPYSPEALSSVPQRYRLEGPAGKRLVPVDTGDVCVNVDAKWFAEQGVAPPTSLEDLADPRYRDLLVVESPVTSSPGLALLAGTVGRFGEDGAFDFWERLKANGVRVRPSWDDAYFTDYTVSGGDRPLVLSYATSPPAEVVLGEGARTEPQSTVLVDSCAAQVEYAGVLRGAPQPELAKQLVDFMLSPAWQRDLPLSNFVLPVVDGVPLPEEFQKWAVRAPSPMTVPAAQVATQRDEWVERWRNLFE
jgi:thiamine transport system substrate-binding protein